MKTTGTTGTIATDSGVEEVEQQTTRRGALRTGAALVGAPAALVAAGSVGGQLQTPVQAVALPGTGVTVSHAFRLEEQLRQRIVGQEEAVSKVAGFIQRSRSLSAASNSRASQGPMAAFLFLGPSGVGKTVLAKALAEALFGSEEALDRLDMRHYSAPELVARLTVTASGDEEGGRINEAVRRRPRQVLLLDEVEKAHPEVLDTVLQILEKGELTDGSGLSVDFRETLVIMTSSIPHEGSDALKETFRPEFLRHIDEPIVFKLLDRDQLRQVVELARSRTGRVLSLHPAGGRLVSALPAVRTP